MSGSLRQPLQEHPIDRRSFVKAGVAASAIAALGMAGCTPANSIRKITEHPEPSNPNEGTWVSAACWHNCGGRCVNKVLVRNGVVVRQKTDDTHEDSPEYFQQRSCCRGRSQRKQVLSSDRIRKPLKRSSWTPGGGANSNGELRGIDEWVEVEWDEALTTIAGELDRIKTSYGNRAFFIVGSDATRFFAKYGGYVTRWGTTSFGTWAYTPGTVGFIANNLDETSINDRFDLQNCSTILLFGSNAAWSSAGSPTYHAIQMKEKGVNFIVCDPFYNDTIATLDAEWVPTRPGTDTALLIGLAHEMLAQDAEKQLIDWDFLNKYTIGFDAEHMPAGADIKGNFKDYLLGTYDGVPKNAAWASKRCGVAAEKISELAVTIGKNNNAAIMSTWGTGRNQQADSLPQVFMTVGAMGGHMGKSGNCTGICTHSGAFNGGISLVTAGSNGLEAIANPIKEDCFCDAELWRGIYTGKYTWSGNSSTRRNAGVVKDIDIRVIWHADRSLLQTCDDQNMGILAHRKVDLVIANASFLTTNAKYSDFILPVSTPWERDGGFLSGNTDMLIMYTRVLDRYYETYSDMEIFKMLAEKVGIDPDELYPISSKQIFYNQCKGAKFVKENGEEATLISFSQAEIDELGVAGEPQEGEISFTEYKQRGVFQIKRKPGDGYTYIAMKDFVADPDANPMPSESGKLEIYSQKLADTINSFGYSTITPIPTYYAGPEGYPGTFKDGNVDGGKGEFPLQLYNPHYLRRSHTVFDNVQWLREAWTNPVYINASDATAAGIENGNTVKIVSPHGATLRTACLTERMMPGVVGVLHGAWVNVDETNGIDLAGSDNYLTGTTPSGQGASGWNSAICRIELYSSDPLVPDVELPRRVTYNEAGAYTGSGTEVAS